MEKTQTIIGIDARAAAEVPAGRGRVVRELLKNLNELPDLVQYKLYCRTPCHELALDERFEWITVETRDPFWHARTALRANRECDVFYSTNSYLTPLFCRIPVAVLVYDMIPFKKEAKPQKRAGWIERRTLPALSRKADAFICISEATRRDLVELFPRVSQRATVITLAADSMFGQEIDTGTLSEVSERLNLPEKFILSTCTLEPRKNLERLVLAYRQLSQVLRSEYKLVLVGPKGWEFKQILSLAAESSEDILFPGYVSDEDLAAIYRLCSVFCYPSLYEGFGLPVLEAMQSQAPIVTSAVSAIPEVSGDAAVYVDPLNIDSIARGISELLSSEEKRSELVLTGSQRAESFSWTQTARETLDLLQVLQTETSHP